jgi:predicted nucleic acid-binding protein
MTFVLDASVTLAWAFEDEGGEYADAVLKSLRDDEAITTSLWPLEISNGLLVAERKGRIDATSSARFARLLLTLPVIVEPLDRRRVFETTQPLARRYSLSAYDAHYLELSVRWAVPLATLDGKLMAAAEAEGIGGFGV